MPYSPPHNVTSSICSIFACFVWLLNCRCYYFIIRNHKEWTVHCYYVRYNNFRRYTNTTASLMKNGRKKMVKETPAKITSNKTYYYGQWTTPTTIHYAILNNHNRIISGSKRRKRKGTNSYKSQLRSKKMKRNQRKATEIPIAKFQISMAFSFKDQSKDEKMKKKIEIQNTKMIWVPSGLVLQMQMNNNSKEKIQIIMKL